MKSKFVRIVSVALLIVLVAAMSGCYGSFELVKKVHKFNGTFGNKWVNELGFLVMNIVPVYQVAGLVDMVVLNSIEFWSGKNPASASNETVIPLDQASTLTLRGTDGTVLLSSKTESGTTQYIFEKASDGTIVKDTNGKVLARCSMGTDGSMSIYDGSGKLVANCSAEQVQFLSEVTTTSR